MLQYPPPMNELHPQVVLQHPLNTDEYVAVAEFLLPPPTIDK